ncbi:MAG TPA: hypothetical protein PLM49_06200, partial [Bacteroidales bacterium]|nr:hypothetical protein [Bacteroidales bacterium]
MKKPIVLFSIIMLFVINLEAQKQVFINPQLIDGLRYIVYESSTGNDATHVLKVYKVTDSDSTLLLESRGLFDGINTKFIRNGKSIAYNEKKEIVENTYYLADFQHEKHPSIQGAGWHTGNYYQSIPLLDYRPPQTKSENHDMRLIAESQMISTAAENCIAYNWLDNSIKKTSDCNEKLTWWLPNLQFSQDDNYTKMLGFEFEMSFVAEESSDLYPIQIMLGNSPKGFYYL